MAKKQGKKYWSALCAQIRKERDITQAQAAQLVRSSLRSWAGWENGEQVPSEPVQLLLELLAAKKI